MLIVTPSNHSQKLSYWPNQMENIVHYTGFNVFHMIRPNMSRDFH